ncbi:MAG TPA: sn-glycerol-3-phosphate ABC transporter ATP-binding protein UgpC [Clostridia bacterium]|nr:sn-glycerol-3-phosphate ABC transporter ATP-binding protein UgpC [Clostridia bacterium]
MAHIRLAGINKVYPNGFHAIHDFSMDIEKGEFIVFVGPSGCGKSTMLRMIAGLEEITGGGLYIGGALANEKSPRARGVAMVFQSYALYPHMSVYENLAFGLTLRGLDRDIIEKRVHKTAKILGLTDYLERKPRELSGGQRQRVAVGRAIIRHVEVFLMDEPLSNLDAKQRVTMRAEIMQIHRRIGATTIYVTHDQTEAMTMADRIVVLKDGVIQQIGTPRELYFTPANRFVAGFIGEPPMNFLPCAAEKGRVRLTGTAQTIDLAEEYSCACARLGGGELALGFRPENALVCAEKDAKGCCALEGRVELTEMLGDNVNVYMDNGACRFILRIPPYDVPRAGETLRFYIPKKDLFLFEAESGAVVARG